MGKFTWEGFGEEGLDEVLLVEEVAEVVGDAGWWRGSGESSQAPHLERRVSLGSAFDAHLQEA